jgi:hypothetical protein
MLICLLPLRREAGLLFADDLYLDKGWLIWNELVPPSWNPEAFLKELKLDEISDYDPRAEEAFNKFMEFWNQAPGNPEIDGRAIKMPGFVVPLDFESYAAPREFLLVPYFGACLHAPPPPPNQIVYVKMDQPPKGVKAMDVIWVYGTIKIDGSDTDQGRVGYSLKADKTEPYQGK